MGAESAISRGMPQATEVGKQASNAAHTTGRKLTVPSSPRTRRAQRGAGTAPVAMRRESAAGPQRRWRPMAAELMRATRGARTGPHPSRRRGKSHPREKAMFVPTDRRRSGQRGASIRSAGRRATSGGAVTALSRRDGCADAATPQSSQPGEVRTCTAGKLGLTGYDRAPVGSAWGREVWKEHDATDVRAVGAATPTCLHEARASVSTRRSEGTVPGCHRASAYSIRVARRTRSAISGIDAQAAASPSGSESGTASSRPRSLMVARTAVATLPAAKRPARRIAVRVVLTAPRR